jgi:hypothetical protein
LVGATTVATVLVNKVAPRLLDHYLGRTGYASQQAHEAADPGRPANLWEPVEGDRGAHGAFDDRAHGRSLQLWAATHRGWVAVTVAGIVAAALARAARR